MRYALGVPALALAILVTLPLAALVLGARPSDVSAAIADHDVLIATATSVGCAALAVGIGLLFGVPAGYLLARDQVPWRRFWKALFDLPVVVPHPIIGIGLLLVFAKHRLVGAALREGFGIQVVSAMPGVVIAMLVVSSPFIVKSSYEAFRGVPLSLERAARSLGASDMYVLRTVALPLAWRNIRSGALLAWARAVSEFGSIVIIAYYPRTAPVLVWDRFSAYGLGAALGPALILLGVCLAIFLTLQALDADRRTVQELER